MTPLITVVTGTYNRLPSLKRMVESVRRDLPRGLAYDFVIVDGGSEDGTLAWCKDQSDIHLIEHGALLGAINAFCEGASLATGEYVLLANDDIEFKPYSILSAISHLEKTPTCGAVAFADNRTSLVTGDGTQYRVEGIGATSPDGQQVMVVYPQVGLIRRQLGDRVGWWGWHDAIMRESRTYGGDSFLGASIWEAGYTVDAVPLAMIEDFIQRDNLRDLNASLGNKDSSCYYARFPTVQLPKAVKQFTLPDRLRILHLPIYEPNFPQAMNKEAGLTEALADYGLVVEIDWLNSDDFNLAKVCEAWQPDLLITQIQGEGPKITPSSLATARSLVPSMVCVNWCGDAHEIGLSAQPMLDLLKFIDLQLVVNAKVIQTYQQHQIPAAYWQIGYKDPAVPLPDVQQYEVLFQGNCYNTHRDMLLHTLRNIRLPNARKVLLGVYGNCKGANGNTHYNFAAQRALYQSATITIGDTFPDTYAFVSNRVFQALSSGAFLLQQHSPGLEEFTGLKAGIHYVSWSNLADLKQLIPYWLQPEQADQRQKIANDGREFVRKNYSYPAQVKKLFEDLLPLIEGIHVTA